MIIMKKFFAILAAGLFVALFTTMASALETSEMLPDEIPETETIDNNISRNVKAFLSENVGNSKMRSSPKVDFKKLGQDVNEIIREEYQTAGWEEVISGPRTSEEVYKIVSEELGPKAVQLAYMDIDEAPGELHDYILSARRDIIYRFNWDKDFDNEFFYSSMRNSDKHIYEIYPRFSDLFPGWTEPKVDMDLPDWKNAPDLSDRSTQDSREDAAALLETQTEIPTPNYDNLLSPLMETDWYTQFSGNVYLSNPGSSDSAAFTMFNVSKVGEYTVKYKATYLAYSANYNIGATNMNTNSSLYFRLRVGLNDEQSFSWTPSGSYTTGIRASTYGRPGTSTLVVQRKNTFI